LQSPTHEIVGIAVGVAVSDRGGVGPWLAVAVAALVAVLVGVPVGRFVGVTVGAFVAVLVGV
jgi:hypothetical protein